MHFSWYILTQLMFAYKSYLVCIFYLHVLLSTEKEKTNNNNTLNGDDNTEEEFKFWFIA